MQTQILKSAFLVASIAALFCFPVRTSGQEPSALKTMIAMEELLIDAIEKSQESVVAIARVFIVLLR